MSERCAFVEPKYGEVCGFDRKALVHLAHDEHEAEYYNGAHCMDALCHPFTEPRICQRCGEPVDDRHVRSPFLCAWNPDRNVVSAALARAKMRAV